MEIDRRHIELALWNAVDLDNYDSLRPLAYPDVRLVVICFAIDGPDSLDNIQEKVRARRIPSVLWDNL